MLDEGTNGVRPRTDVAPNPSCETDLLREPEIAAQTTITRNAATSPLLAFIDPRFFDKWFDVIMDKFFIVGCPRSGTTVLQQALNRHSRIVVAPETRFFYLLDRSTTRGQVFCIDR